jgi:hypothetical protein
MSIHGRGGRTVVRRVTARIAAAAGAVAAGVVLAIALAPATAPAAPKQPKPTAVQIVGAGLPGGKVLVEARDQAQVFQTMLSEVSWLATAPPQAAAPTTSALGPRYTVTVLAKKAPQAVYELYPLAKGGPRAHRPAKQPTGKKADGWFYGRLTMSESLRRIGAPLKAKTDVVTGGIGGGTVENVDVADLEPAPTVQQFFAQLRRLLLLNVAVLVVILFGLGGIAFLIRRRV